MKKIVPYLGIFLLLVSVGRYASAAGEPGADALGGPTALKLVIVPNGFKLTWMLSPQDPGSVTGYEIVRADRASGPFEKVAVVKKAVSEFVDTTASKEVIYYYKVKAMAGKRSSPYSNTVTGER
jgi:hypothetical protein